MYELDHLMWEEWRLSEGEKRFAAATGVTPAFGGKHPEAGTHNSLLSLGPSSYLEIIALDPEHPSASAVPEKAPPAFMPRLIGFGVRVYDLTQLERQISACGLEVGQLQTELHTVSRQSATGHTMTWRTAVIGGHTFGRYLPFFTYCGGRVHSSEISPKGCHLLEFSVGHPRARELSQLYAALQIDVPVFQAAAPKLLAILSTPKGLVSLDSQAGLRHQPGAT